MNTPTIAELGSKYLLPAISILIYVPPVLVCSSHPILIPLVSPLKKNFSMNSLISYLANFLVFSISVSIKRIKIMVEPALITTI